MKRVQYLHYGGPEELRLDEVKPPDAGRGQIRVRVRAAAANPMDWKIRRGEMKALSGFRLPRGLGHDFAGVVEVVGPTRANQSTFAKSATNSACAMFWRGACARRAAVCASTPN
jgi:NADPH:quinone reductase-like Zn-dependent oxidoreductase